MRFKRSKHGRAPIWATELQIGNEAQRKHNGITQCCFLSGYPYCSLNFTLQKEQFLISVTQLLKSQRQPQSLSNSTQGQQSLEQCWDWYAFVFPLTFTLQSGCLAPIYTGSAHGQTSSGLGAQFGFHPPPQTPISKSFLSSAEILAKALKIPDTGWSQE